MTDIKLFRVDQNTAVELESTSIQVEKSLQTLFERNLENILGIRFLATEYSTGPVHGGRIDTLGLDENGSPVIIEFKRAVSENVINQGLFYLDWLLDHQREFQWLVMDVLGKDIADSVEWSSPRLLCIAGDFTRYDGHAVKQIPRRVELLRYRRFGDDLLMLELVHVPPATDVRQAPARSPAISIVEEGGIDARENNKDTRRSDLIAYRLQNASVALRDVWDSVVASLQALGDDIQTSEVKLYYAFKRLKNFACLELYPTKNTVVAFLRLNPATVLIEPGFTRDMRGVSHFGTGDLQVTMRTMDDVLKAQPLFARAYEGG